MPQLALVTPVTLPLSFTTKQDAALSANLTTQGRFLRPTDFESESSCSPLHDIGRARLTSQRVSFPPMPMNPSFTFLTFRMMKFMQGGTERRPWPGLEDGVGMAGHQAIGPARSRRRKDAAWRPWRTALGQGQRDFLQRDGSAQCVVLAQDLKPLTALHCWSHT